MKHPHVLIVMLDSARPDWLSCFNAPVQTTPNIDGLAREGYVFEQAISPSAWTFPVMASVFTAMLPSKHGGHDEHQMLDSEYPTLAEVFSRHGYDTAAFADVPYVGPSTRLDRGFSTMSNLRAPEVSLGSKFYKAVGRVHRTVSGRYQKTNETRVVIRESLRWLKQGRDRDRPFLLYIHSDEPHAPYLPPASFRRRFAGISRERMHSINQDKQLFVSGRVSMEARDFEDLRRLALGETAFFDHAFGELLSYLRREGLLDDTIVVVAADHGDNIGEHGLLRHGMCLYDTLLHVPLMIRPAGGVSGQRVGPMVRLIDLLPTLMGLAEIEDAAASAAFQGCDLIEAVRTGRFPSHAVSELYRPTGGMWAKKVPEFMDTFRARFDRRLRSYRTNTHKYIWSDDGRCELYDLENDPGETRNLIEEAPELGREMEAKLTEWAGSFTPADPEAAYSVEDEADERVYARLRELGYVE